MEEIGWGAASVLELVGCQSASGEKLCITCFINIYVYIIYNCSLCLSSISLLVNSLYLNL